MIQRRMQILEALLAHQHVPALNQIGCLKIDVRLFDD